MLVSRPDLVIFVQFSFGFTFGCEILGCYGTTPAWNKVVHAQYSCQSPNVVYPLQVLLCVRLKEKSTRLEVCFVFLESSVFDINRECIYPFFLCYVWVVGWLVCVLS